MTKEEGFFTYAHFRKSDGRIFYIGKGRNNRHLKKDNRNEYWRRTVLKHGLSVEKLAIWETEKEAFEHEKFLIWCFRDMGVQLANLTSGGDGLANPSIATRLKLSQNNAMRKPEIAVKISLARKGVKLSEDHSKKISQGLTGRKLSDATRAKMSARYSNGVSEEYHNKLSESAKKGWAKRRGEL